MGDLFPRSAYSFYYTTAKTVRLIVCTVRLEKHNLVDKYRKFDCAPPCFNQETNRRPFFKAKEVDCNKTKKNIAIETRSQRKRNPGMINMMDRTRLYCPLEKIDELKNDMPEVNKSTKIDIHDPSEKTLKGPPSYTESLMPTPVHEKKAKSNKKRKKERKKKAKQRTKKGSLDSLSLNERINHPHAHPS